MCQLYEEATGQGFYQGVPSPIKNDPASYQTRAANRENFTEDGTGYFVWDKAPEKGPSQSCKWIKTHGWEASCDQSSIYFIGDWWKFCPRCGKPLEVVE